MSREKRKKKYRVPHAKRRKIVKLKPKPKAFVLEWGTLNFFNEDTIQLFDCGSMIETCALCSAKFWLREALIQTQRFDRQSEYALCCGRRKLNIPPLPAPPKEIQHLWVENTTEAKHFRERINVFNSSLAMASMGCSRSELTGRGPPVFKVHGVMYHRTGTLFPDEDNTPKFAQMYIYDTEHEIQNRLRFGLEAKKHSDILRLLQQSLKKVNPLFINTKMQHKEYDTEKTFN